MHDASTPAARFHRLLSRWRLPLLGIALAHFIAVHYFVLGFVTWDGLGHRVPPVVELVQHSSYGLDKYANWALVNFHPFIELLNAPFLWALGQDGLIFAFAVTLFPACIVAVYLFVRELTGDERAAFYSAVTYVCIPLINAQVFSGHVDWAIPGLLAFYLHSLLVLGREHAPRPRALAYVRLGLAVCCFTMARQQGLYLSVAFLAIVGYPIFVSRCRLRFSLKNKPVLVRAVLALAIGITPAVAVQILSFVRYGSPIYPYRFELFGLKLGNGMPMSTLFQIGGLSEYSLRGFWKATQAAYFVPARWPYCFFDGRNFGDSIFVLTALAGLPLTIPRMNRRTRVLLVSFVVLSLALKDFWQPRYAYGLLTSICICNGIAIAALLERHRLGLTYATCIVVLGLHALRPEWDAWRLREGDFYPRINVTGSKAFITGNGDVPMFPDRNARILVVRAPGNSFILPLYGRKLTNSVVTSVAMKPDEGVGPRCEVVRAYTDQDPEMLVVDDEDLTKHCPRTCVLDGGWRCMAFKMQPDASAQPAP